MTDVRIQQTTLAILEQHWTQIGCIACRHRPTRLYLINDEPDPPADCGTCGRHVVMLVRRYVLTPGDDGDAQVG